MPLTLVSEISANPRIQSLKEKHIALSNRIEDAQKNPSTTDYFLNQLKKQKLMVKERIVAEERDAVSR